MIRIHKLRQHCGLRVGIAAIMLLFLPIVRAQDAVQPSKVFAFDYAGLKILGDFPAAGISAVTQLNDSLYLVDILPEAAQINPSPWYAFKLVADKDIHVRLQLRYGGFKHRYQPKIAYNGVGWINYTGASFSADHQQMDMQLQIGRDTLWVAADEPIDVKRMNNWIKLLQQNTTLSLEEIGRSVAQRPIVAFSSPAIHSNKAIMILSRQHPPEISGYKSMQYFVERLLEPDSLAVSFRADYTLHVVPYINPDGVELGYWRHNRNNKDLNRDWIAFSQPETQAVQQYAENLISKGIHFYFAIDFHSTYFDVLYTNTHNPDSPNRRNNLVLDMVRTMQDRHPTLSFEMKASGNTGNVSKSWMNRILKADGLTYESGDATDEGLLRHKARAIAESLMLNLLNQ